MKLAIAVLLTGIFFPALMGYSVMCGIMESAAGKSIHRPLRRSRVLHINNQQLKKAA